MPSPILLLAQRNRICSVCGHEEDGQLFRNHILLGSEDQLCVLCFDGWYDGGITDCDELKAYSILKREQSA